MTIKQLWQRMIALGNVLLEADIRRLPRGRRPAAYAIKLIREALRELESANYLIHASAMAFRTLLALVPFVVVVSGISAGLFPDQSDRILDRAASILVPADARQGPSLGGGSQGDVLADARLALRAQLEAIRKHAREINIVGLLLLLYTVLSLMASIESSLNVIWHVKRARGWIEKLPFYVSIMFLAPIFLGLSISLTTALEAARFSAESAGLVPTWARGPAGYLLNHGLAVLLVWAALLVTYTWVPSANVRRGPAAIAALVGALGFELLKQLLLSGIVSVVRTNQVYGALAVLPILFLWLYLSWVVILFGAGVGFVVQNFEDLTKKADQERRGLEWRPYYALRIVLEVARRFKRGEGGAVIAPLVQIFDVPEYAVRELCADLAQHGVLAPVVGDASVFLPAKSLMTLTVTDVITAAGAPALGTPDQEDRGAHRVVAETFRALVSARDGGGGLVTVAELLGRIEALEA